MTERDVSLIIGSIAERFIALEILLKGRAGEALAQGGLDLCKQAQRAILLEKLEMSIADHKIEALMKEGV